MITLCNKSYGGTHQRSAAELQLSQLQKLCHATHLGMHWSAQSYMHLYVTEVSYKAGSCQTQTVYAAMSTCNGLS